MNTHHLRTIILTLTVFITASVTVHAAYDSVSWPYYRSIDTVRSTGMVKALVPTDISWVKGDFSDIRIIDVRGGEVPYLLTRSVTSSAPSASARILNMSSQNDGTTRFVADTGQSGIVRSSIDLMTSSSNFRRQVSIYASDTLLPLDDTRWSLVNDKGFIFNFTDPYSRYSSGKNTISFPDNASRYFKIVVSGGAEGAVTVTGVTLTTDVSVQARSYAQELPVAAFNNPAKKTTEVVVDLGATGQLSHEITLYTSSTNYSRRVVIESSDDRYATSSWKYIGQGSISGVSTSVFQGYSNTISYPEQRTRYIRASIVNDDNPPLVLMPKVTVQGSVLTVIFEAQQNTPYYLYYGNRYASMPNYDIGRLSSYIQESSLPIVSVGQEIENTNYLAPEGPTVPFSEAHPWLLNAVLVLVVILIGGGIAVYLRTYMHTRRGGNDQGSQSFVGRQPTAPETPPTPLVPPPTS